MKARAANLTAQDREQYARASYERAVGEKGGLAAVEAVERHVDVYELPSGRRLHRLDIGASPVHRLYLSEKNSSLCVVAGDVLERWDLATGKRRRRSDGAGDHGLTADAAGRWVATLAGDGTVWLWDARTGDRLGSILLPKTFTEAGVAGAGEHSSLAFSTDGKRLWSITEGGQLLSCDTSVDGWADRLCGRVGRPLADAERDRYLTSVSDTSLPSPKDTRPAGPEETGGAPTGRPAPSAPHHRERLWQTPVRGLRCPLSFLRDLRVRAPVRAWCGGTSDLGSVPDRLAPPARRLVSQEGTPFAAVIHGPNTWAYSRGALSSWSGTGRYSARVRGAPPGSQPLTWWTTVGDAGPHKHRVPDDGG